MLSEESLLVSGDCALATFFISGFDNYYQILWEQQRNPATCKMFCKPYLWLARPGIRHVLS